MKKLFNVIQQDPIISSVDKIEQLYNAQYVGDFAIKDKNGNWMNRAFPIFYQEDKPRPDYKDYFTIFSDGERFMIADAQSAVDHTWTGLLLPNGVDIIYSRYRHDYVSDNEGNFIDGGPSYTRYSRNNECRLVNINIIEGQLIVSEI